MQVRTPRFKAWFGDWETARAQQALEDAKAIPVPGFGLALEGQALRAQAQRAYATAASGGPVTMRDGRKVALSGVGFKKTRSHSADRRVLDLLGSIRSVLEGAVPVVSLPHRQEGPGDSVRAWHYYAAKVRLNDEVLAAKLVVRGSVNGEIDYDNDLSSLEGVSGRAGDATQTKTGAAAVSADRKTLADLLRSGNVSKVLDPDTGEPMVVFHGTTKGNFTAFNRLESTKWRRASMDTVGSWFSDNPSEDGGAGLYAAGGESVIYPAYLSIQSPKKYRTFTDFLRHMHRAAGRPRPQEAPGRGSTEELRAELKADGHDGIEFEQTDCRHHDSAAA